MFNEAQKQAYNNIKAPEHLRERVLSSALKENTERKRFSPALVRRVAVLAACLVCVFTVSFIAVRNNADVDFYFDGARVTEDGVGNVGASVNAYPFSSRSIPGVSVKVELKTNKACHIYVNGGVIAKEDGNTENVSSNLDITEDSALIWNLENPVQDSYTLTAQSGNKTFILVLEYKDAADEWVLYEKK